MANEVSSRIEEIMSYYGLNKNSLATKSGLNSANLGRMLSGKQTITDKTIEKICNALPKLNIEWIKTGEGDMLLTAQNTSMEVKSLGHAVSLPSELLREVRMFTVTPTATFTEMAACFNDDYSSIGIVPEAGEYLDDSYAVFEIRGESMEPTVRDHAKILCKEMPESRWYDAEGVVVISYRDKVVLKRILRNSFYTDNSIILGSDNPDKQYAKTETVQRCDIHAIFKAKRILSQDII